MDGKVLAAILNGVQFAIGLAVAAVTCLL